MWECYKLNYCQLTKYCWVFLGLDIRTTPSFALFRHIKEGVNTYLSNEMNRLHKILFLLWLVVLGGGGGVVSYPNTSNIFVFKSFRQYFSSRRLLSDLLILKSIQSSVSYSVVVNVVLNLSN